jgi:hypothetical protein
MTDTSKAATIARRAAVRLAEPIDTALPDKVEKELSKDPFSRTPDRVLDPISVASLIVSLVSFGWTVYRDLKKDRAEAAADRGALTARVAAQLHTYAIEPGRRPPGMNSRQEALIIEVIADEIVTAEPRD